MDKVKWSDVSAVQLQQRSGVEWGGVGILATRITATG